MNRMGKAYVSLINLFPAQRIAFVHLLFCVSLLFLVAACNKNEVLTAEGDGKPVVEFDSEDGRYTIKVGRELSITPTYENAEDALFSWTIEGKMISNGPTFHYTWDKPQEVYVKLRVDNDKGTAEEELKIEVCELTPPVVSIVTPAKGLKVLKGTDYTFTPDIQHKDMDGFAIEWVRDGKVVSTDTAYTFKETVLGSYSITVNAWNVDGRSTCKLVVEVVATMPLAVYFPTHSHNMGGTDVATFSGRKVLLRPLLEYYSNPVFEWSVDGVKQEGQHDRTFEFVPAEAGEYEVTCTVKEKTRSMPLTRNITRGSTGLTAAIKVVCVGVKEEAQVRTSGVSRFADKVYEYTPAPGQFINEVQMGGFTGNETTPEAAVKWAEERLKNRQWVSLGSFGGYIIVGFDHSVMNSRGNFDFAIQGNAFEGSSEPGIVWVSQDVNGNGLPDDVWYELRGSESGKPETKYQYEVTYFRPAGKQMAVQWVASDGRVGCVDYLIEFHRQDYYYPAWVSENSYTLTGTCLDSRNRLVRPGFWENVGYDWGYADNYGNDMLPGGNTVDGSGQRNGFKISEAVYADGKSIDLQYIDFVKVQCGVLTKSGWLGENSTEVFSFEDLSK